MDPFNSENIFFIYLPSRTGPEDSTVLKPRPAI
jgi:hypothetical protein